MGNSLAVLRQHQKQEVFLWKDYSMSQNNPIATPLDPTTPLTVAKMAALTEIKPAQIRRHIKSGAPVDAKGRITLAAYCAWPNAQLAEKQ